MRQMVCKMLNFWNTGLRNCWLFGLTTVCLIAHPITSAMSKPSDQNAPPKTISINKVPEKASNKPIQSQSQRESELKNAVKRMVEAYQQEQYASALAHCHHVLNAVTDDTPTSFQAAIGTFCMALMARNDQHENALELAQKLRSTQLPEDVRNNICFMEATSLTKLHRWQDARNKYAECPGKTDAERAIILSNVAELAMIEGDSETAVSSYLHAALLDHKNPHIEFGWAAAYARHLESLESGQSAFLRGVMIDPNFTYLKDAFFEPKAENDFQTALRMYLARRLPEALFYMTRYTEHEQRIHYKTLGQQWTANIRADIANYKSLCLAQYPVLLEHVRSIALNNAANLLAFVTIQKSSSYDFITVLWILDTETGKTRKRLTLPEVMILDMAFVGDSTMLRLLGGAHRYELDAVSLGNDYYIYENTSNAFPMFLTASGQGIGRMRDDLGIEIADWVSYDTAQMTPLKTSMDIQQLKLRHDKKISAYVKSKQVFIGYDSALVYHDQDEGDWDTSPIYNIEVNDIAVHPVKNIVALGMQSGTLLVDVLGNPLELYGSPGLTPISKIAFSPDGKKMAAFGEQTVEIWDLENIDDEEYTSIELIDMCEDVPTVEELESWNTERENDEKAE